MIHLQARDHLLLRTCYEQQFLTVDHARQFFLACETAVYRRLRMLKKAGLVSQEYHPIFGKFSVFRLTALGNQLAEEKASLKLIPLRKLNPSTLIHDALVTSVRLKFAHVWNATFVPERAIKTKDFPEIPDGIFYFKSGKGIAIEIENSDKGRFRFQKLLDRWKFHPSIGAVLYIASHPVLFETLWGYLKEAPLSVEPLLGIIEWGQLKSGSLLVTTQIGNVDFSSVEERLR